MGLSECWPAKCFVPAWYLEQVACTLPASHSWGRTASKLSGETRVIFVIWWYHYCWDIQRIKCSHKALGGIRKQTKIPSAMSTSSLLGKKQHSRPQASCTLGQMKISVCQIVWHSQQFCGQRIQPDCYIISRLSLTTTARSHEPRKLLAKLLLWQCKCWLGSSVKISQTPITSD